jgi:trigger factor
MNKENRKLAQEKRAAERQRKEQQEKTLRTLKLVIPTIIIVALVIWVIADYVSYSSSNKADETETTTEAAAVTTDTGSDDDTDVVLEESEEEGTTLYTGTDVAVEDGDTVNIDYVGTVDGVEFSGGNTQGQGTDLVIGSGSYIDDFEEQLIGHYVGETVDVTVTFPDPYANDESLSGKEAVFETTINGIYK